MRAAIFLVFFVFQGAAIAATREEIALQEARVFLIPCGKFATEDHAECAGNQQDFLESWLHARSGDVRYTRDMQSFFGTQPPNREGFLGVRTDWREGFAWEIVEEQLTTDPRLKESLAFTVRILLRQMPPQDQQQINTRAQQLLNAIRYRPTPRRPDRKLPSGLDSTVVPLPAD